MLSFRSGKLSLLCMEFQSSPSVDICFVLHPPAFNVPQQRLNMCIQFFGRVGFLDVVVHTHLIATHHVRWLIHCRSKNDGDHIVHLPNLFYHFVAIHHWHIHIGHNDIRPIFIPLIQAFRTISGFDDLVAAYNIFHSATNHIAQYGIILY